MTLLLCSIRYGFSYITFNYYSRWARYSYRTAFLAAAATYGIVVYKAYRARSRPGSRQQGGILALVGDENVQYLGPFNFSHCLEYKLIPYYSYGACLAFWKTGPSRSVALHGVLRFPCRNLHSHEHSSHNYTTPAISSQRFSRGTLDYKS